MPTAFLSWAVLGSKSWIEIIFKKEGKIRKPDWKPPGYILYGPFSLGDSKVNTRLTSICLSDQLFLPGRFLLSLDAQYLTRSKVECCDN